MTAITNIQTADNGITGNNKNNNCQEAVVMQIKSNIQGIFQSNAKVLAGMIVGGMTLAASILPAGASADSPSIPSIDIDAASSITKMGCPDVDDYDTLAPRVKSVTNLEFPNVDDYDTLLPRVKPVTGMEFPDVDDFDILAPRVKQVTSMEFPSEGDII